MIGKRERRAAGIVLAAGLMAASQACAEPDARKPEITPYKAVYTLSFDPAGNESPFLAGGTGRMTVEFKGSRCTDYQILHIISGSLNTKNGPVKIRSEARSTENPAGTRLAFSFKDVANGNVLRQDSLLATRDGGVITVASRALPGGKATLPAGTVLPLRHDIDVMAAAGRDLKSFTAKVYNPEIGLTTVEQIDYSFGPNVTSALPKGHPADIEPLRSQTRHRV